MSGKPSDTGTTEYHMGEAAVGDHGGFPFAFPQMLNIAYSGELWYND